MDEFIRLAQLSLDPDLSALVGDRKLDIDRAMQLQMLRIMRGRPFQISLNAPQTPTGWPADGVKWFAQEPGTSTTGNGLIPPEAK